MTSKGTRKKSFSLMAVPIRGRGVKVRFIKEKNIFFFDGKVLTAIKLERGGGELRP